MRKRPLPPALVLEGTSMLRALTGDLAALPGAEPLVARDADIELGELAASVRVVEEDDPWAIWSGIIAACDAVWPIAPETDGLLEQATQAGLRAGKIVLNSRPDALAITRSKLETVRHLREGGIPAVPTARCDEPIPAGPHGWVVKPEDGTGAIDTHFLASRDKLDRWRADNAGSRHVVQPFVPGLPLSLSMLAQDGVAWLLSCNLQKIERRDGGFTSHGIVVGGAEHRRAWLQPLADRIAAVLPGLWGHVGVDVIDGEDGPVVLEINPRLTTSYVGLARSLGMNPAGLVISLLDRPLGSLIRPLAPRPVSIRIPLA